jgi:hypothetical protein
MVPLRDARARVQVLDPKYRDLEPNFYRQIVRDAIASARAEAVLKAIFDQLFDPDADHFAGPWAVTMRSFEDYMSALTPEVRAVTTRVSYWMLAGLFVLPVLSEIGKRLALEKGLTFVQFHFMSNAEKEQVETQRPDIGAGGLFCPSGDSGRAAILLFDNEPRTRAHETGHALFLCHKLGGPVLAADDSQHENDSLAPNHTSPFPCIMSYDMSQTAFCGTCQLRMRGWDPERFSVDVRENSAP